MKIADPNSDPQSTDRPWIPVAMADECSADDQPNVNLCLPPVKLLVGLPGGDSSEIAGNAKGTNLNAAGNLA